MKYTPPQLEILVECRVVDEQGNPVRVELKWPPPPNGVPLGWGPKLDNQCIKNFLDADPSLVWTRWIFHQAAGGKRGLEGSKQTLAALKDRFMQERTEGYYDEDAKKHHEPISKSEAADRWTKIEPVYADMLHFTDQDCVDKAGAYGFYRHWPGGPSSIYSKVIAAVTGFLDSRKMVEEMNTEMMRIGGEPLGTRPEEFETVEDLEKATRRVHRFFASKAARIDYRVDSIYKSERIEVLAPLTYAASVRYGCEAWPWSDPKQFETLLTSENAFANPWKTATGNSVYVFIKLKGQVPSWVVRHHEHFNRCYLSNLCIQIPKAKMTTPIDECPVFNEENDGSWHLQNVRRMIIEEPHREVEETEEMPVVRGGRAYATEAEAAEVLKELNNAVTAIVHWQRAFNTDQVIEDCLVLPS